MLPSPASNDGRYSALQKFLTIELAQSVAVDSVLASLSQVAWIHRMLLIFTLLTILDDKPYKNKWFSLADSYKTTPSEEENKDSSETEDDDDDDDDDQDEDDLDEDDSDGFSGEDGTDSSDDSDDDDGESSSGDDEDDEDDDDTDDEDDDEDDDGKEEDDEDDEDVDGHQLPPKKIN